MRAATSPNAKHAKKRRVQIADTAAPSKPAPASVSKRTPKSTPAEGRASVDAQGKRKGRGRAANAPPPAPPLPRTFKIVAGSYEKLLYGLEASFGAAGLALTPIFIFPAHVSCVKAVAASPAGGKWLATGSADEIVKVWDLRRRREIGGLVHHEGACVRPPRARRPRSRRRVRHVPRVRGARAPPLRGGGRHARAVPRARLGRAAHAPRARGPRERGRRAPVGEARPERWQRPHAALVGPHARHGRRQHQAGQRCVGPGLRARSWTLIPPAPEGERVCWSPSGARFAVQSGASIDIFSTVLKSLFINRPFFETHVLLQSMALLHTLNHASRVHDVKFFRPTNAGRELDFLLVAAEDKKVTIYELCDNADTAPRPIAELVGHTNR